MHDGWGSLETLVAAQCVQDVTPHCFNLLHQIRRASKKEDGSDVVLNAIVPAYLKLVTITSKLSFNDLKAEITGAVEAIETYLGVLRTKENDAFVSQSDFKTSVIPEFFLRIFHRYIQLETLPFAAVGQKDIPIEIAFDLKRPGLIVPRLQRVDIAIIKRVDLLADGEQLTGFCIPLFAAEAKTYFDKNMVSGVDFSVAAMKTTFPHCLYFAIGEFADFDLAAHSYASSDIDEIFVLRKQKRASWRKTNDASPIDSPLVLEIVNRVIAAIKDQKVVHRDLSLRIPSGRLILGNHGL